MNQENTADTLNYDGNKPKLPAGLNVLTILTFIWCVIELLWGLWNFVYAQKAYERMDEDVAELVKAKSSDNIPGWIKGMMPNPDDMVEMITKGYNNRIPIVLLSVIAVALCFFGALQMRKLKKQGFIFYTIGEILPFATMYLFIGAVAFSGIMYVFLCFALLFIILYASQRKKMIY